MISFGAVKKSEGGVRRTSISCGISSTVMIYTVLFVYGIIISAISAKTNQKPEGVQSLENEHWSCKCHPKNPLKDVSLEKRPPPLRVGAAAPLQGLPTMSFDHIPPRLMLPSCRVDTIYGNCVPTNAILLSNESHADDIPFGGR